VKWKLSSRSKGKNKSRIKRKKKNTTISRTRPLSRILQLSEKDPASKSMVKHYVPSPLVAQQPPAIDAPWPPHYLLLETNLEQQHIRNLTSHHSKEERRETSPLPPANTSSIPTYARLKAYIIREEIHLGTSRPI
jgi:hypothetical protein